MSEAEAIHVSNHRAHKIIPYLILLPLALVIGWLWGQRQQLIAQSIVQTEKAHATKEIIVSDSDGLVFKSEGGQLLAKLGTTEFGNHFSFYGSSGKPAVQFTSTQDKGSLVVGNNDGGYVWIGSVDNGGYITLINKYGKQVLELSSYGDGNGTIVLGEAKQGYKIVELDSAKPGDPAKGSIRVFNNGQTVWSTP